MQIEFNASCCNESSKLGAVIAMFEVAATSDYSESIFEGPLDHGDRLDAGCIVLQSMPIP